MKFLELMARLGLWPFDCQADTDEEAAAREGGRFIVVPPEATSVVHRARWPTEDERRTYH